MSKRRNADLQVAGFGIAQAVGRFMSHRNLQLGRGQAVGRFMSLEICSREGGKRSLHTSQDGDNERAPADFHDY